MPAAYCASTAPAPPPRWWRMTRRRMPARVWPVRGAGRGPTVRSLQATNEPTAVLGPRTSRRPCPESASISKPTSAAYLPPVCRGNCRTTRLEYSAPRAPSPSTCWPNAILPLRIARTSLTRPRLPSSSSSSSCLPRNAQYFSCTSLALHPRVSSFQLGMANKPPPACLPACLPSLLCPAPATPPAPGLAHTPAAVSPGARTRPPARC